MLKEENGVKRGYLYIQLILGTRSKGEDSNEIPSFLRSAFFCSPDALRCHFTFKIRKSSLFIKCCTFTDTEDTSTLAIDMVVLLVTATTV
jgi:hypothetical protein